MMLCKKSGAANAIQCSNHINHPVTDEPICKPNLLYFIVLCLFIYLFFLSLVLSRLASL